jgi:ornithine carbamoyltransferase
MRHLVSVEHLGTEEIRDLLELAVNLKGEWSKGGNKPALAGKTLGMVFQKPSLRTRVSFEVGMSQLGGRAMYLSPQEGLAAYASVPVINGLSDYVHPCQGLSDLLTIYEKRGALRGLVLAYVGDGNNVAHSLLFAGSKVGMEVRVSTPPGCEPSDGVVSKATEFARETGGRVVLDTDPHSAVRGADVVYTDAWASMGQEDEHKTRLPLFRPYQVNEGLISSAKPDALVMHCLPAHRGEEITDEVIDGPQSAVLDQAENRMHLQKALLVTLMGGSGA